MASATPTELSASLGTGCPSRFAGGQRNVVLPLRVSCNRPAHQANDPRISYAVQIAGFGQATKCIVAQALPQVAHRHLAFESSAGTMRRKAVAVECSRPSALRRPADKAKTMPMHMNRPRPVPQVVLRKHERLVNTPPPNPSIEGTASGLRPPAAPHVKR